MRELVKCAVACQDWFSAMKILKMNGENKQANQAAHILQNSVNLQSNFDIYIYFLSNNVNSMCDCLLRFWCANLKYVLLFFSYFLSLDWHTYIHWYNISMDWIWNWMHAWKVWQAGQQQQQNNAKYHMFLVVVVTMNASIGQTTMHRAYT